MAKLIINNSNISLSYLVISDSYANLENTLDIWIKFTSYLKPDEVLLLEKLQNKNINSVPLDEINEYLKIKKQVAISELLLKYKKKECNKEEHDLAFNFMHTSLTSFVRSRLTESDRELASKCISKLETNNQLKQYIELHQKKYEDLSIYEAYVLFEAKERLYYLGQRELNEKIRHEQVERAANLKKNLLRDYGYKF